MEGETIEPQYYHHRHHHQEEGETEEEIEEAEAEAEAEAEGEGGGKGAQESVPSPPSPSPSPPPSPPPPPSPSPSPSPSTLAPLQASIDPVISAAESEAATAAAEASLPGNYSKRQRRPNVRLNEIGSESLAHVVGYFLNRKGAAKPSGKKLAASGKPSAKRLKISSKFGNNIDGFGHHAPALDSSKIPAFKKPARPAKRGYGGRKLILSNLPSKKPNGLDAVGKTQREGGEFFPERSPRAEGKKTLRPHEEESSRLEEGSHRPHHGIARSEEQSHRPHHGIARSEEQSHRPHHGIARSEEQNHRPHHEIARSEEHNHRPHHGIARSEEQSHRPHHGIARSEEQSHRPHHGIARSEEQSHRPHHGIARSEEQSRRPHHGIARSEEQNHRPHHESIHFDGIKHRPNEDNACSDGKAQLSHDSEGNNQIQPEPVNNTHSGSQKTRLYEVNIQSYHSKEARINRPLYHSEGIKGHHHHHHHHHDRLRPHHHHEANGSHHRNGGWIMHKAMTGVADGFLEAADGGVYGFSDTDKRMKSHSSKAHPLRSSFESGSPKGLQKSPPQKQLETRIHSKQAKRKIPNPKATVKRTGSRRRIAPASAAANVEEEKEMLSNRGGDVHELRTQLPVWEAGLEPVDEKVRNWMRSIDLEKYATMFGLHEVTNDVLPLLTMEDLKEMGINAVGARRKLYIEITKLKQELMCAGETSSDGR